VRVHTLWWVWREQLDTGDLSDIKVTPGTHQLLIWATGEFTAGEYYKHRTDSRGSVLLDFGMACACPTLVPTCASDAGVCPPLCLCDGQR
jgi:hypothetical protein